MRLALRETDSGQKLLEPHTRRMRCPLQLDDHLPGLFSVRFRWAFRSGPVRHGR
jgi:hypothetical protein